MNKTHWMVASVVASGVLAPAQAHAKDMSYKATVDVRVGGQPATCGRRALGETPCHVQGRVFLDKNRNGRLERREEGVKGVLVSNGREVVETSSAGEYRLPVYDEPGGTTLFITKPAGYDVPLDELNVPQFYYHHIPAGSPPLRFGGLPPSGPLPKELNFPLIRGQLFFVEHIRIIVSSASQRPLKRHRSSNQIFRRRARTGLALSYRRRFVLRPQKRGAGEKELRSCGLRTKGISLTFV